MYLLHLTILDIFGTILPVTMLKSRLFSTVTGSMVLDFLLNPHINYGRPVKMFTVFSNVLTVEAKNLLLPDGIISISVQEYILPYFNTESL